MAKNIKGDNSSKCISRKFDFMMAETLSNPKGNAVALFDL